MSEKIVELNEEVIKGQSKELVRGSVEETLNELLEAETEKQLTQAAPVFPCAERRISPRPCGAARYLLPPSVNETRKPTSLRIGVTVLCNVANIHMFMRMIFTCAEIGAASTKMLLFWWQLQQMRTDAVKFWALQEV